MKKKIKSIWNTRISKKTSSLFQKVGSSIEVDKRLFKEDIDGSIAHVEMLCTQKIISNEVSANFLLLDFTKCKFKANYIYKKLKHPYTWH